MHPLVRNTKAPLEKLRNPNAPFEKLSKLQTICQKYKIFWDFRIGF